jgi:hypothetical protein
MSLIAAICHRGGAEPIDFAHLAAQKIISTAKSELADSDDTAERRRKGDALGWRRGRGTAAAAARVRQGEEERGSTRDDGTHGEAVGQPTIERRFRPRVVDLLLGGGIGL